MCFMEIYMNSLLLSKSATQHTMPPEFRGKRRVEYLNTGLPLPTLLHAGYSVYAKGYRQAYNILVNRIINVANHFGVVDSITATEK